MPTTLHRKLSLSFSDCDSDTFYNHFNPVKDAIYPNPLVISDFVDFKFEQRCYIRNGRILSTTPCSRKMTFFHSYPKGKIHPYFIPHHNSPLNDLILDRKMAAEMAIFVKKTAKEYDLLLQQEKISHLFEIPLWM